MKQSVLLIGGRGYLGRAIQKELEKTHTVYTFDRHTGRKNHYQGSIQNKKELQQAIQEKTIVINLVGLSPIQNYTYQEYHETHVQGTKNIIETCKKEKTKHYIHIGALGATKKETHPYLQTKAQAIQHIKQTIHTYTIINPSIIFDKESELVTTIKKLSILRMFPNIQTRTQPIHRKDITKIIRKTIEKNMTKKELQVAGPKTMTIYELAKIIFTKQKRICIPIPLLITKPFIRLFTNKNLYQALLTENTTRKNDAKNMIQLTNI